MAKIDLTIIHTPYKVGSTTLFDRISGCRGASGGHYQLITGEIPHKRSFIIKSHSGRRSLEDLEELSGTPVQRVITLLRRQKEIFVSAYFQNIGDTIYPYSFGNRSDVEAATTEQLVKHFLSIEWHEFPHLSLVRNAEEIEKFCGVNYLADIKNISSFRIYTGNRSSRKVIVGVAHLRVLNQEREFRAFMRGLKFPLWLRLQLRATRHSNLSSQKWYSSKIKAFKSHADIMRYLAAD